MMTMKNFKLEWNYENGEFIATTILGDYIELESPEPFLHEDAKQACADDFLACVAALPNELVFTNGGWAGGAECETVFGVFDCRETWLVIFRDYEQDAYGCLTDTKAEAQAIYRDLVRSLTNGNQEGCVAGLERQSLTYAQCYDLIESAQKDLDQPWRWSVTRDFEVCLGVDQFQDLLCAKLSADDTVYLRCEIFPDCCIVREYPLKDILTD